MYRGCHWLSSTFPSRNSKAASINEAFPEFLGATQRKFYDRGLQSTEVAFLLLSQQPWVQFLAFPKISFNAAEIYRHNWLEGSDNVDQTHLVLASTTTKKFLQSLRSAFEIDACRKESKWTNRRRPRVTVADSFSWRQANSASIYPWPKTGYGWNNSYTKEAFSTTQNYSSTQLRPLSISYLD